MGVNKVAIFRAALERISDPASEWERQKKELRVDGYTKCELPFEIAKKALKDAGDEA